MHKIDNIDNFQSADTLDREPKGSLNHNSSENRPEGYKVQMQPMPSFSISDREFRQLSSYIKEHCGINLKDEKKALVSGRLHSILQQNNFANFSEYYEHVIKDKTGREVTALINRITTNHTFFMREAEHFYYFRDKVLPVLSERVKEKDLRIWSAGCSSGEEPYTLAMLLDEFFGKDKVLWDTRVLATDISAKVLETAIKGVYDSERLSTLPSYWKLNYFNKLDKDRSVIVEKLRNEVIFRKFNLMEEVFPFRRKFHIIFCRNVMIYFDTPTKNKLINKFYDTMETGGYLFIGHSESLSREESKFKYVMPSVYRKD